MKKSHTNFEVSRRGRHAFTLVELLVAISIIVVLASIAVVGVGRITDGTRISSGVNTVVAALNDARASAIQSGRVTGVVFRVDWDPARPDRRQRTELVLVRYEGGSETFTNGGPALGKDILVPVQDATPRVLPVGIKVASPEFLSLSSTVGADDNTWGTQPELALTDPDMNSAPYEHQGRMIGVLFNEKGRVITMLAARSARNLFVDFNGISDPADASGYTGNERQDVYNPGTTWLQPADGPSVFYYDQLNDEPNLQTAKYLAVYDDDAARELKVAAWTNANGYYNELTGPSGYITQFGERIHFNRYSGVVLRP